MKVAVIIPAYNEEKTILETLIDLRNSLPSAFFFVMDNNSKDQTVSEVEKFHDDQTVLLKVPRQGKGEVLKEAFKTVVADYYIIIDGDATYKGADAQRLLDRALERKKGPFMLVGDRFGYGDYQQETQRAFHLLGNKLVSGLLSFFFQIKLCDVMSGLRVLSRDMVEALTLKKSGFEVETELTLWTLKNGLPLVEYPIHYEERAKGNPSKLKTFQDGFFILSLIFKELFVLQIQKHLRIKK